MSTSTITSEKGHPPGLYLLFTVEMWERFSYYAMRAILILYATALVNEGGLAMDKDFASKLYGWFTGIVYLTPLLGGYLADNYLGGRKAITIGGILMMLGQFTLASYQDATTFYIGLGLLALGNGFFKPNISTIVGQLYAQGDRRRDSAFTIFYMGINTGALIAPLIMGMFEDGMYRYGFAIAGVGMGLGQIIFNLAANKYLGKAGIEPEARKKKREMKGQQQVPLTKVEKERLGVICILAIFTIAFWMSFEQAGSSMNLYARDFIDRSMGSGEFKTSWFQSVNPALILLLAPLFSILWLQLGARGKEPSIPIKMGMGLVLVGIGFLFLVGACMQRGESFSTVITDTSIKASMLWLVIAYVFHTMGELCISPIGLSMVTKLSPPQFGSMMMGVWFFSIFIANLAGGYVAAYVEVLGAYSVFFAISILCIVLGLLLLAVYKPIRKMMHGVQ